MTPPRIFNHPIKSHNSKNYNPPLLRRKPQRERSGPQLASP